MKNEKKIKVDIIAYDSGAKLILDAPKGGDKVSGSKLTISGWAYTPGDDHIKIAVKIDGSTFITSRNISRSDVRDHLKKQGQEKSDKDIYGFEFDLIGEGGALVGFELNGSLHWTHRITQEFMVSFQECENLQHLFSSSEGTCGNIYFHNAKDWSKVVILFNGALTPHKITSEKTIFQRWSWANKFKHPVLSIADPLTIGDNPLVLGWYLGKCGPNQLPEILKPIIAEIKRINSEARIIGLGSSGGGFAAMGAVLTGHLDEAIVINPQTDAMLFDVESAVSAFSAARNHVPCDSDLKKYDLSRMKPESIITYIQNKHDIHHVEVHYKPFRQVVVKKGYAGRFSFIEYEDKEAGHMPPDMHKLIDLTGRSFRDLLK